MNKWEYFVINGGEMPTLDLPDLDEPYFVEKFKYICEDCGKPNNYYERLCEDCDTLLDSEERV